MSHITAERLEKLIELTRKGKITWREDATPDPDLGDKAKILDSVTATLASAKLRIVKASIETTSTHLTSAGAHASGSLFRPRFMGEDAGQYDPLTGMVTRTEWVTKFRLYSASRSSSRWHQLTVEGDLTDLYRAASANEAKVDNLLDDLDTMTLE